MVIAACVRSGVVVPCPFHPDIVRAGVITVLYNREAVVQKPAISKFPPAKQAVVSTYSSDGPDYGHVVPEPALPMMHAERGLPSGFVETRLVSAEIHLMEVVLPVQFCGCKS